MSISIKPYFELKADQIIGTAAQLATGACTCKYTSSDQKLYDADTSEVTLNHGDRIWIIGLDALTDAFDLSAYNRLRVTVDPSVSLANSSQDLEFGDDCFLDLHCADATGVSYGTGCHVTINNIFRGAIAVDVISEDTPGSGVTIDGVLIKDGEVDGVDVSGLDDQVAKAWVNFNGTGTVAIRDSFNVSSITDNGTGDYTVNFTNAMANTNYCPVSNAWNVGSAAGMAGDDTRLTTSYTMQVTSGDGSSVADMVDINVVIFGDQ